MKNKQPLVLCILDGCGHRESTKFNAVKNARTPTLDSLLEKYPHTLLHASGVSVGLPEGQMGNSEVGHTTIGLGQVIFQDLLRISMAAENGTLKDIEELKELIKILKKNGGRCHLWGLLSDGGVHSHIDHLFAIVDVLHDNGIEVLLHASLDGRDTPPKSAISYLEKFEKIAGSKAKIATVAGRYFSMDRDKRWDRIEKAYNVMVRPTESVQSAKDYVNQCYANDKTDEFIPPMAIGDYDGIHDGDAFVVFNFRTDRVRQMLSAIAMDNFSGFTRPQELPKFSIILGVTEYSAEFFEKVGVMFKKFIPKNTLGEVVSAAGLTQFRTAETEKYPHVTFFFNGGREEPLVGEERALIASPKVATYDLQPEMSAFKLTDVIVERINNDCFDFYVINYANLDMVGHTGNYDAAVKAAEAVDECIQRLYSVVQDKKGHLIITADHGNAEEMFDENTKQPHTAHTTNDVWFVMAADDFQGVSLAEGGSLRDIAPTILDMLGIDKPSDMSGESLILR